MSQLGANLMEIWHKVAASTCCKNNRHYPLPVYLCFCVWMWHFRLLHIHDGSAPLLWGLFSFESFESQSFQSESRLKQTSYFVICEKTVIVFRILLPSEVYLIGTESIFVERRSFHYTCKHSALRIIYRTLPKGNVSQMEIPQRRYTSGCLRTYCGLIVDRFVQKELSRLYHWCYFHTVNQRKWSTLSGWETSRTRRFRQNQQPPSPPRPVVVLCTLYLLFSFLSYIPPSISPSNSLMDFPQW